MHANRKIRELMAERRSIYNQVTELTNRIKQQHRGWRRFPAYPVRSWNRSRPWSSDVCSHLWTSLWTPVDGSVDECGRGVTVRWTPGALPSSVHRTDSSSTTASTSPPQARCRS